jgi:hypothetical protein
MKAHIDSRVVILALVLATALASSSCDDAGGFGMGVDSGARWSGGSGPPVFVGGPSR